MRFFFLKKYNNVRGSPVAGAERWTSLVPLSEFLAVVRYIRDWLSLSVLCISASVSFYPRGYELARADSGSPLEFKDPAGVCLEFAALRTSYAQPSARRIPRHASPSVQKLRVTTYRYILASTLEFLAGNFLSFIFFLSTSYCDRYRRKFQFTRND